MIVFRSALLVINGPIAVRKHAAAIFHREKFIILQVCHTGSHLVFKFLRGKSYPSDWKLAKVTPIFTAGSKTALNNYRPISVIPAVAKIFEKIIYDQLYNYLNVNDLLTSCQSGYRAIDYQLSSTIMSRLTT